MDESLYRFAQRLLLKLRDMKIPQDFNPGGSREKADFKNFLEILDFIRGKQADMAIANSITVDYIKQAALGAVKEEVRKLEANALHYVIGFLGCWKAVDACANACATVMVNEYTLTEKQKKSLAQQPNQQNDLPYRYFLHATLAGCSDNPAVILGRIIGGLSEQFGKYASLDDYGWLQGSVRGSGMGEGSSDGIFMVVRLKDMDTLLALKEWLGSVGCKTISTPQMVDVAPVHPQLK